MNKTGKGSVNVIIILIAYTNNTILILPKLEV